MNIKTLSLFMISGILLTACNTGTDGETTVIDFTDPVIVEEEVEFVEAEKPEAVLAAEIVDFEQEAYEAALAEGKDVFLDFHANWCSTCAANAPKIESAFENGGEDLVAFRVNYDFSDELQKTFGVTSQSTLVMVDGGDEEAFRLLGPGLLDEEEILEFMTL